MSLRNDADLIIKEAIARVLPDEAVASALNKKMAEGGFEEGRLIVVAAGKAAWQMAKAASDIMGEHIDGGVCVTKYDHVKGAIPGIRCFEAGHPVPDENSFLGTSEALKLVEGLSSKDTVLFLLSGGGSALFEKPLISGDELADITAQLLGCSADITEINTIRKRLSAVKGGKFAKMCEPAHVFSIVLSDIIGDPLDMIASGPAYPDSTSSEDALAIINKYGINLSKEATALMHIETPKILNNVETVITGSVKNLCAAAADACKSLGYEPVMLTDRLTCVAKEAGSFMASIARSYAEDNSVNSYSDSEWDSSNLSSASTIKGKAFIAGGETVVLLTGKGKGGRNQELALAAAEGIAGLDNVCIFSVGSDGTDGPTDAAGGYVDGNTATALHSNGINIYDVLQNNDAYNALRLTDGLIITGATGTNVNDFTVALVRQ